MTNKSYSELIRLPTFEERFEYLRLRGAVGDETFGFDRIFNQIFYGSKDWKRVRDAVIARDKGCDLGIPDREISKYDKILVHHIVPITMDDIANATDRLLNPEYLITVSHNTHNAIHYGEEQLAKREPVQRTANDTCPWKD